MTSLLFAAALALGAQVQTAETPPEDAASHELLTVRRIYVDKLTGGETAAQMRDMIISSLQNCRLFVITENPERADTILRGSAEDLVFTDVHTSSDSLNTHANFGTSRSTRERGQYGSVGAGESESAHSAERRHEAVAAVRLVNKEGDVIWSTTEESTGGKFRGSSADVADKITRRLMADYQRAKKPAR
ncbi:MAG TPA: hypothetical protein VFA33_20390 [Bryobacteraceae bacterium]|nr:hypothetical protein [Bryobacteraceae bacterium]